jgi:nucleotide-binding universal stress UspA family protein
MSTLRRILVPVDFSEPSRLAFDYAAELAQTFGAELDVLHVWEAPAFVPPGSVVAMGSSGASLVELVRKGAEDALQDFVANAERRGTKVRSARAEMGHAVHTITEAASRGGYDLVVMGTHGRSGLSRALIGSVAERVVRHAPCPVLTVRAPARQQGA